jgi:hypothetical protein
MAETVGRMVWALWAVAALEAVASMNAAAMIRERAGLLCGGNIVQALL